MFDIDVLIPDFWSILDAVPATLAMAFTIFIFSTLVGGLFALVEYRRIPVLRELVVAYKVAFKGIPMVVMIFLAYYGLPTALAFTASLFGIKFNPNTLPNWAIIIVALTACVAAFQAEVVKGALNSFDSGQSDAANSLGYSSGQLFRRVLFPQVIIAAIPDLANSFMVIMKALSLAFAIEVVDIFAQAQLTAALNFYYLEAFLIAVVFYMVIAYVVTKIADKLEAMLRIRT
ncbi:amino acid ABC transporter permease [Rouxiella badensis]|jgi:L-cystine transport system permease protein|uniref:Amino acid ABC transporter n=2 Tax=Rouxiella badensis TaxID=1646377 RepID=A0A1X0WIQ6_9GAMM|nr:ABC transporter permease subunit [Rouxiella badensis]MCC3701725.1 ABC transporter permease subunit [Rouxiella badensis]MCC3720087.1 ABC transporter permease subunit [Rouxiella badensis]MCC3729750.1 ABC transporter permease subunit [Rouxiella badensis]MCC3731368.1 ABC transporter permease subunit [Rouxiella badensis]MCC3738302.1 ABC transporter permease subunit [Rouxiella badensis]